MSQGPLHYENKKSNLVEKFRTHERDTGSPEVQVALLTERIFEPWVRGPKTGVPGIGLGLATVKRLVESHGGAVGVRAGSRGGALFWFELPRVRAPIAEPAPLPAI